MTTQQQAPRHRTVVTAVGGKTPKGTPFITVDPWFQTKQPFNIYINDEKNQKIRFKIDDEIVIERGQLRPGKDPDHEYNYFWNYAGFANDPNLFDTEPNQPQSQGAGSARTSTSAPAAGSVPQGAPAAPKDERVPLWERFAQNLDSRDISIIRQVALKETMNYCIAFEARTGTEMPVEEFDRLFQHNVTLMLGIAHSHVADSTVQEELPF